ncbi:MAG TPA: branched-chain amino acid ABC transporter permease [Alphaproteobacteria bacterium]|nr:branched-chain amino acid ABC transporter permease [Alphaproteobacteria bacterium]
MWRIGAFTLLIVALWFVENNYVLNLLVVIALQTMSALGLSLLMGYTGQISLGHAAFYGLGAYGSALISMRLGLNPWLSIFAATAIVAGIGWSLGWLVFRLRGHHLAMATLAFGVIVYVGFVELHDLTGGPNGLQDVPIFTVLGTFLDSDRLIYPLAWGACILTIVLAHNLVHSPKGLSMRSVAENERVAASLGQDVSALKRQILMLSAAWAAFAGGIWAHYLGYLSPNPFDVGFSIKLLVMVAIGGFANIWGVLFGVAFVTILGQLLKPFGFYDVVIYGLLLVIVMVFFPNGLLDGLVTLARSAVSGLRGARA